MTTTGAAIGKLVARNFNPINGAYDMTWASSINYLPEEDGIVVAVGEVDDAEGQFVAYGSGKDQAEALADLTAKIERIKAL